MDLSAKCKGKAEFKACLNCRRFITLPAFQQAWIQPIIRRDEKNILRCQFYIKGKK